MNLEVFNLKQVMVMRADLHMSAGKLAAQACHASVAAFEVTPADYVDVWKRHGTTKIVLSVNTEAELMDIYKKAVAAYLPCSLIVDEGRTEIEPGTITGVGIGPAPATQIDAITGGLNLYA